MGKTRLIKCIMIVIYTIALGMAFVFPVPVIALPFVFFATSVASNTFFIREAGILSSLRSVCRLE